MVTIKEHLAFSDPHTLESIVWMRLSLGLVVVAGALDSMTVSTRDAVKAMEALGRAFAKLPVPERRRWWSDLLSWRR